MSKKLIKENLNIDWLEVFDGMTGETIVRWIQDKIPAEAVFKLQYEYDNNYGEILTYRDETEEEKQSRLKDQEVKAAKLLKRQSQKRKDDLANLRICLTQLESCGGDTSQVKFCIAGLERLEKEGMQ